MSILLWLTVSVSTSRDLIIYLIALTLRGAARSYIATSRFIWKHNMFLYSWDPDFKGTRGPETYRRDSCRAIKLDIKKTGQVVKDRQSSSSASWSWNHLFIDTWTKLLLLTKLVIQYSVLQMFVYKVWLIGIMNISLHWYLDWFMTIKFCVTTVAFGASVTLWSTKQLFRISVGNNCHKGSRLPHIKQELATQHYFVSSTFFFFLSPWCLDSCIMNSDDPINAHCVV